MKKIILYITLIWTTVSIFTSCDLDTNSTNKVDKDVIYESLEDIDKVLTGAWVYAMETFNSYANPGYGAFLRANDAMGSDVVLNAKYGFSSHYAFSAMYGKGGTNTLSWLIIYRVINNMNIILRGIDQIPNVITETQIKDRERIRAQAYALRGYMYLHLASVYSLAIDKDPDGVCGPIYTEDDKPLVNNPASSVSQIYQRAILDFENALAMLPASYSSTDKWRMTKPAILGLLSRTCLYAREWEKAKIHSDALLAINDYLMTEAEYKSGFNDINNKEWLLAHPQSATQNDVSYQFNYLDVTSSASYYFSFNADPYFKDLFNDGDYRKSMINWKPDPGISIADIKDLDKEVVVWMRYAKFKFKENKIADIVLMRTSEIYLINAEAKARLNHNDAISKLNDLKRARNATTVSGLTGDALIKEIWLERRKELFGEGFALVDIIRNQQTVVRKSFDAKFVTFQYTDDDQTIKSRQGSPRGHHILVFPDKSEFKPNSKYYLYRPTNAEIRENKIFYKNFPESDIYKAK